MGDGKTLQVNGEDAGDDGRMSCRRFLKGNTEGCMKLKEEPFGLNLLLEDTFALNMNAEDKSKALPMTGVWMKCQENIDAELSMQIDIKILEFLGDIENKWRITMAAAEIMKNTIGLP